MKVETPHPPDTFRPVSITLTFESAEEIEDFYALFNAPVIPNRSLEMHKIRFLIEQLHVPEIGWGPITSRLTDGIRRLCE